MVADELRFLFYGIDDSIQYWLGRIPKRASRRGVFDRLAANVVRVGTHVLVAPRARWIGCQPVDRQRIYFANHSSHLDFPLLWSVLPASLRAKARPVAARDYWDHSRWKRRISERAFRSVFVERNHGGGPLSIAPMLHALDRGDSLILFPEGTRGTGQALQSFRTGIFHLAEARPGVELVPVWMDNNYRVLPKGSFLPVPLLCTATFGPPLHLASGEEKHAFLQRAQQQLELTRTL